MASDFKTAETKLLAIYKLDFYKKKKYWKLSEHVRKEPSSKIINKLNKTYEVGEKLPAPELDVKLGSPHNEAFLQEEPEDGSDPQPPTDELSKLVLHHSWPEQVWGVDKTEGLWEEPQQDWCGAEAEGVREELAYDQCDGPYHEYDLWDTASMLKLLKPSVDPPDLHQDYMATKQILQETGDWLNMHGYVVKQEEYADAHDNYESSRTLENPPLAVEEYPMLGIDSFRPVDRIVSGSVVPGHDMDTGPVCGQLQPHNLIGIRMGRPYRL